LARPKGDSADPSCRPRRPDAQARARSGPQQPAPARTQRGRAARSATRPEGRAARPQELGAGQRPLRSTNRPPHRGLAIPLGPSPRHAGSALGQRVGMAGPSRLRPAGCRPLCCAQPPACAGGSLGQAGLWPSGTLGHALLLCSRPPSRLCGYSTRPTGLLAEPRARPSLVWPIRVSSVRPT
jgi:hypothetical protein